MSNTRMMLLGWLLVLAAACGRGEPEEGPSLQVESGWVRAMPFLEEVAGGRANSAAYMVIRNQGAGDDRLLGGESPASERTEVHETRMIDEVMRMRQVDKLDVPAYGSVRLAPGGLHIMLMGLTEALQEGDSVELTLRFERSGDLVVSLPVRLMGEG